MAKKISAQHQELLDKVLELQQEWDGPGSIPPHVVAHEDPDTKMLTFHLRGLPSQLDHILGALRRARR
jgi:hypothetical protein